MVEQDRPGALVLLGATGDLAGRFLLPALSRLLAAGRLPDDLRVVGAAPGAGNDASLRAHVAARLAAHATDVPASAQQALVERLSSCELDLGDPAAVDAVLRAAGTDRPPVVYLALPPTRFAPALAALRAAGLPPGSRVVVEKPFGQDLAGAVALNTQLADLPGGERAAYRVDHVLGMPAARELLELRRPGTALAPLWDGVHLEQVDLLWEETLGLEGRVDFFDRSGALRDVVQNHLLQLLALVALELPDEPGERDLHASTLDVLRSVRPLSGQQLRTRTRRARYTAGRLVDTGIGTGTAVPDYADEPGVDPARGTETWAELVLELGGPRWPGTRFVLRAGKALAVARKGVRVHPRPGVRLPGAGAGPLWLELDREPDGGVSGELLAYTAVLEDVLSGGSALSVGAAAAEQAWRVVEPVLRCWSAAGVPLLTYPAGSVGPLSVVAPGD